MIDLKPFCSTEESRFQLQKPWTSGGFSYATNGHIAVRVSTRPDVPTNPLAPNAQNVFDACAGQSVSPLTLTLPKAEIEECVECDGADTRLHSCPDCTCICAKCAGTGEVSSDESVTVNIRGTPFALKYARMISALPGLCFADKPPHDLFNASRCPPSRFTFDGGEGCLMPVTSRGVAHIEDAAA